MRSPARAPRPGQTLIELVVVLALVGLAGALATGAWRALADRTRVRMAAADLAAALADARDEALARAAVVAARIDSADGSVVVRSGADTLAHRRLGALHGVRIAVSRESVTYSPLGIGRGLANARFVLARGSSAETVWVSRLGRVRVGSAE
jgi:Tfp pilus assembly protein FimT